MVGLVPYIFGWRMVENPEKPKDPRFGEFTSPRKLCHTLRSRNDSTSDRPDLQGRGLRVCESSGRCNLSTPLRSTLKSYLQKKLLDPNGAVPITKGVASHISRK